MKLQKRTARVIFDESTPFSGLEVVLNLDLPMTMLFEFVRAAKSDDPEAEDIMRKFGDFALASWNLEDDAGAVPADGDGFLRQPMELARTLMQRWTAVAAVPSGPLVQPSKNGETSEAESTAAVL